jgi:hypothetical protein
MIMMPNLEALAVLPIFLLPMFVLWVATLYSIFAVPPAVTEAVFLGRLRLFIINFVLVLASYIGGIVLAGKIAGAVEMNRGLALLLILFGPLLCSGMILLILYRVANTRFHSYLTQGIFWILMAIPFVFMLMSLESK